MTISQIRNKWLRRSLVVLYGTLYIVVMAILAIIFAICEGAICAYEAAQEFLDDLFGPLRSAWRGRRTYGR